MRPTQIIRTSLMVITVAFSSLLMTGDGFGQSATANRQGQDAEPYFSDLERKLGQNWQSRQKLNMDLSAALLIAEGVDNKRQLNTFRNKLKAIDRELNKEIDSGFSAAKKGQKIYRYLHRKVLKKYDLKARLKDTFSKGKYNCLTSTALFCLVADRFKIPLIIYVTSNHVYVVVNDPKRQVKIEMTDPQHGFDFKVDTRQAKQNMIDLLLNYELITKDEVKKRGVDAIYQDILNSTKPIPPIKLISLVYGNIGSDFAEKKKYRLAMDSFEKALAFDPDNEIGYLESYQSSFGHLAQESIDREKLADLEPLFNRVLSFRHEAAFIDSTFLPAVGHTVQYFELTAKNVEKARQILANIKKQLTTESALIVLAEYEKRLDYNQAIDRNNSGDRRAAYRRISELYHQRPEDEDIRRTYLGIACNYVAEMVNRGLLHQAIALIDTLQDSFANDPQLTETAIYVKIAAIKTYSDRADYEPAYRLSGTLQRQYPNNQEVEETYLLTAHNYGAHLLQRGKINRAESHVDSLYSAYPSNPTIKEIYVQVKSSAILERILLDTDPALGRKLLLDLQEIDPVNKRIKETLAFAYNRLAIAQAEKNTRRGLKEAKRLILEGLKYDRDNSSLKENLRIIEDKLSALNDR